jgi:type II secretion system protein N
MKTSLKWLLYIVYASVAATFFFYFLFPSQAVHRYLTYNLNRAYADLNVKIGLIKPTFPPALLLNNVKLHYKDEPVFETLTLEVQPTLQTLWKDVKTYSFNCDAYGGTAQGQFTLEGDRGDDNPPVMHLIAGQAQLAEMQIDRFDVLRFMPADYKLKGAIQGKIVFKNDLKLQNHNVKVRLKATGVAVKILNPLLLNLGKLGEITSDRIDINFSQNNQLITLTQLSLKGKQLNAKLSGQISLQKPLERSVINLNGSVQPHRIFLADMKNKLDNLLPPKIFNKNGFSFRIGGTFVKPKFSLR